jgi:DNA replication protein DnaC
MYHPGLMMPNNTPLLGEQAITPNLWFQEETTMVNEATITMLHEMKLSAMAASYRQQIQDNAINKLSFDERFGLLVDTEWTTRKNNRLKRLICRADFPICGACIEDIEYRCDRKLNREQIMQLATCTYVGEKRNVIILGATGSGKTYISCALGMTACRRFFSVKYIRLPELLNELSVARGVEPWFAAYFKR